MMFRNFKDATLQTDSECICYVITSYIFTLIAVLLLLTYSYQGAIVVNENWPLSDLEIKMIQIFSLSTLAVGSLGKANWKIQTYSGNSRAELLNDKISKIFTILGFLLTFSSYYLVPYSL